MELSVNGKPYLNLNDRNDKRNTTTTYEFNIEHPGSWCNIIGSDSYIHIMAEKYNKIIYTNGWYNANFNIPIKVLDLKDVNKVQITLEKKGD